MTDRSYEYEYQVGGCLSLESSTYVKRKADDELYRELKKGQYCYVLNARQMGKSSLRVRVKNTLENDGIVCGEIDLQSIGSNDITIEQWYAGIIKSLSTSLKLEINLKSWIRDRSDLAPIQRLANFIDSVILNQIDNKVIVFIDEIDTVLSLNFSVDDFFALIRNYYNERATNNSYRQLVFCFLGVTSPNNLIQDGTRTPFNIGCSIDLTGFQANEIQPLVYGFESYADNPNKVLKNILRWTNGQPFLTQRICKQLVDKKEHIPSGKEDKNVNKIARDICNNWSFNDEPVHFRAIEERIKNSPNKYLLLSEYQKIIASRNNKLKVEKLDSQLELELRISGLVVRNNNYVEVYNRMYRNAFDQKWIRKLFKDSDQPYSDDYLDWIKSKKKNLSKLLQTPESIQNFISWSEGRSLRQEQYEYLISSQKKLIKESNKYYKSLISRKNKEIHILQSEKKSLLNHSSSKDKAIQALQSEKKLLLNRNSSFFKFFNRFSMQLFLACIVGIYLHASNYGVAFAGDMIFMIFIILLARFSMESKNEENTLD